MTRKRLGEILVEDRVLDETGLRAALVEQRRHGGLLGRILVELQLVDEDQLVSALSRQLAVPVVDLDQIDIPREVLDLVTGEWAVNHGLIPFAQPMKFLDVAMTDPIDLDTIDELRVKTQLNVRPHLAGPRAVERAVARHYRIATSPAAPPRTRPRPTTRPPLAGEPPRRGRPSSQPPASQLPPRRRSSTQPPRARSATRPPPGGAPGSMGPPPITRPPPMGATGDLPPDVVLPAGDTDAATTPVGPPSVATGRGPTYADLAALQERIAALEALVRRDEDVIKQLMALLIEKRVATREEIVERLK